jgi:hypothetical protein
MPTRATRSRVASNDASRELSRGGLEDILGQVLKQSEGSPGLQSGASGGGGLGDPLGGVLSGGSRDGGGSGMATAAAVLAPMIAG